MSSTAALRRIRATIDVIRVVKNWHTFLLDHAGLKTMPYLCKLRNGLRFEMRGGTDDGRVLFEIYVKKQYASAEIPAGSTVVDIGANIGCFSVMAARRAARVIACEPQPENLSILRDNIARNGASNIEVVPCAISTKAGKTSLFVPDDKNLVGCYSLYPRWGRGFIEVPCMTLEDLIRETGLAEIDLLKVDCEGAEHEILGNVSNNLLSRIKQIVVESHLVSEKPHWSQESLESMLRQSGFFVESQDTILFAVNETSRTLSTA